MVRYGVRDTHACAEGRAEHSGEPMNDTSERVVAGDDPSFSRALLGFVHRLREASIPVSMVEALDAFATVRHLDVADREQLRSALRATLVKRPEHEAPFASLFDLYFAMQRQRGDAPDDVSTSLDRLAEDGDGASETDQIGEPTDMLEALLEALRSGDQEALRALASMAVERHGGMDADRASSERYYVYRVLRQLELAELLRLAIAQAKGDEERSGLDDRLVREELTRRVEEFRRLIAHEVRRRLVELKGPPLAAELFHERGIEDVDFLSASPVELARMREAIRPLAQKLAARIAHRRKVRRHGRLDVRRTVRRSLSAGGVPLDPVFRYPRASKPDLYLLCDISGSVAEFARFTMSLLFAMKREFARIRLFVFVDGIDEVTDLMKDEATWLAPRNLLYGTRAIAGDGHSDYGNVLHRFWHHFGYADIDPRSTVIITGDARNNYRASGDETLATIQERARKVYWLNPEPRSEWNTSDSIMDVYAPACHDVFETRNLRQLAAFVYAIT
jgi:uncharacterized protein with von Willebrand factor type A (vWA) domain